MCRDKPPDDLDYCDLLLCVLMLCHAQHKILPQRVKQSGKIRCCLVQEQWVQFLRTPQLLVALSTSSFFLHLRFFCLRDCVVMHSFPKNFFCFCLQSLLAPGAGNFLLCLWLEPEW